MSTGDVRRGPLGRGMYSPALLDVVADAYGLSVDESQDLGGSSNLNLLVAGNQGKYVVRVYRLWVTEARLADMQRARLRLASNGVPCALPVLTLRGESWTRIANRLVELEPYVEHDGMMDSWERIETSLPLLGRIHTLFRSLNVSADGRIALAANHIPPEDTLAGTLQGAKFVRAWHPTPVELELADRAESLAHLVDRAERDGGRFPWQMVHGDFWHNNVLFRDGRIVQVADLDFMGERARIDDLALTLYYTNSTYAEDRTSPERIGRLRRLVDAYDRALNEPLSTAERAALPIALARTTLAFIAMIPSVDSATAAHRLVAEMIPDIAWAHAIMCDLDRWQAGFT